MAFEPNHNHNPKITCLTYEYNINFYYLSTIFSRLLLQFVSTTYKRDTRTYSSVDIMEAEAFYPSKRDVGF